MTRTYICAYDTEVQIIELNAFQIKFIQYDINLHYKKAVLL